MPPPSSRRFRARARLGTFRGPEDFDDEDIQRQSASDESRSDSDSEPDSDSDDDQLDSAKSPLFPTQPHESWAEQISTDLPVLDFADMKSPSAKSTSLNGHINGDVAPSATSNSRSRPAAKNNRAGRRPIGQTAWQAYQNRLEEDPSYVPTVGQFWGHDDRLLDKDLRSLSTWWRGKWQHRGRGFDNSRARMGPRGGRRGRPFTSSKAENDSAQVPAEPHWGHDGFEELRRKEDWSSKPPRGGSFPAQRGRRGPPPFSFRGRGGVPFSPSRPKHSLPSDRPWFSMKPEPSWTKQHEAFLFHEHPSRWSPSSAPTVRVKVGDKPPRSAKLLPPQRKADTSVQPRHSSVEESVVVRLPQNGVLPQTGHVSSPQNDPSPLLPPHSPPNPSPPSPRIPSPSTGEPSHGPEDQSPSLAEVSPVPEPSESLAQGIQIDTNGFIHSSPDISEVVQSAILQPQSASAESMPSSASYQPSMPPSSYDSPYGYSPALPPGIALNHLGVPIEIASGRPMYLQPPAMYDPNSMMPMPMPMPPPPVPSMPSHTRHYSSVPPDFTAYVSQTPMPPPPVSTPSQGDPTFFSYPRQSSKVDIKRPDGTRMPPSSQMRNHARGLSVAAPIFEPTTSQSSSGTPSTPQPEEQYAVPYEQEYSAYPPQYYYPEANPAYVYGHFYPQDQYTQGMAYY